MFLEILTFPYNNNLISAHIKHKTSKYVIFVSLTKTRAKG